VCGTVRSATLGTSDAHGNLIVVNYTNWLHYTNATYKDIRVGPCINVVFVSFYLLFTVVFFYITRM
jgi:hypothetical protein